MTGAIGSNPIPIHGGHVHFMLFELWIPDISKNLQQNRRMEVMEIQTNSQVIGILIY